MSNVAYTNNLNLIKPYDTEHFNIDTWNANMNILDEAFAAVSGKESEPSSSTTGNTTTYIVQQSGSYYIPVYDDVVINFPSYGIIHVTLAFNETMHNVSFVKSVPDAPNIIWDSGSEPEWSVSKIYEISILEGHAIVYMRNNNIPSV